MKNFEDLVWLFTNNNQNRGIIRLNFNEAALLWKSVKMSSGNILEIGRKLGGSTVLLATAAQDRKVISVDISPMHDSLCDIIFSNSENVVLLIQNSRIPIKDTQFGLLFIDGDHSYVGVREDVITHWSHLTGYAIFHDAAPNDGLEYMNTVNHCQGVALIIDELIQSGCAKQIDTAGSMVLLEKVDNLPTNF